MYILNTFGVTPLPIGSPRHTAGTMSSRQQLIQTLGGGVYDSGASKLAPELPFQLVYDCTAFETTPAALQLTLDGIRELRGVEARLYRTPVDGGPRHWATARLMNVEYTTEARHSHGLFQPLSMRFLVKTLWRAVRHGAPWYLDQGHYLDSGLYLDMHDRYALNTTPKTITITNNGNVYTDDVILTLEAGATPVTGLTVTVGSCQLVFSGTVAATKSLVIDCSPMRMSVLNDGVADWTHLNLGASHASEAWFRLLKGNNSVVVTRTGGGSDTYLTVDFSDAWE